MIAVDRIHENLKAYYGNKKWDAKATRDYIRSMIDHESGHSLGARHGGVGIMKHGGDEIGEGISEFDENSRRKSMSICWMCSRSAVSLMGFVFLAACSGRNTSMESSRRGGGMPACDDASRSVAQLPYGCADRPLPAVEFMERLPASRTDRTCTLDGTYTFEHFCTIVRSLQANGRQWDLAILVPENESDHGISFGQYRISPKGNVLFVNPRSRGELMLRLEHELQTYCVEITPEAIRFVLKELIVS